ncbi:hypothetical protein Tco_0268811, partial [Tanacetum coccineum]
VISIYKLRVIEIKVSKLPRCFSTDSETISPIDEALGSLVFTPFPDDPYMLVRQAYSPTAPDTESEPLEAPLETWQP